MQGVFVRNLPQGEELCEGLLEEHFGAFGKLKPMGSSASAVTIHTSPKYGKVGMCVCKSVKVVCVYVPAFVRVYDLHGVQASLRHS